MAGQFAGGVRVEWLGNQGPDRDMKLVAPFAYIDPAGKRWDVPSGAVVNGASIPQIFWTSFGPPFVGDYRRASVVHDHYCDTRTETAQATHRMFYDACRTGGVGEPRASMMYAAVRTFGPQWKGTSISELPGIAGATVPQIRAARETDFEALEKWIEETHPSLDEIDERIEELGPLVEVPVS